MNTVGGMEAPDGTHGPPASPDHSSLSQRLVTSSATGQRCTPVIPDHSLLRLIGKGAYGEVWLARNVMGASRAVKIVWRDRFTSHRPYEREFSGIQKYEPVSRSADGLVHVLHVGRNDAEGYFYYVMELADAAKREAGVRRGSGGGQEVSTEQGARSAEARGEDLENSEPSYAPRSLRADLQQMDRLPVGDCIRLALDVVSGLVRLHERGLVHRDVKPGNIIFVEGRAKLADLGLVSRQSEGRTFVGTEGYIPPEGPGSPGADIFALGMVLYEAVTGFSPDQFPKVPADWFHEDASPDALEFHAVVLKACEGAKERRYRNAEEMQADLALLQSGQSVRRLRALELRVATLRRTGWVAGVTLAIAISVAVLANWRASVVARARAKETKLLAEAQGLLARAEAAERDSRHQLYAALLEQARATVRSGEVGHRLRAMDAIRRAAALSNTVELRREVAAALALPDMQLSKQLPYGREYWVREISPDFQFIAVRRERSPLEIRSVSDGSVVAVLPGNEALRIDAVAWSRDARFFALKRNHASPEGSGDVEVWEIPSGRRLLVVPAVPWNAFTFHPRLPMLLSVSAPGSAGILPAPAESAAGSAGILPAPAESAAGSAGILPAPAESAAGSAGILPAPAESAAGSAGILPAPAESAAGSAGILPAPAESAAGSAGILPAGAALVRGWELPSARELGSVMIDGAPNQLHYSPDGAKVAASYENEGSWWLAIHDAASSKVLAKRSFASAVTSFQWDPTGRWLGVTELAGSVHWLDAQTGDSSILGRHKAEGATTAMTPDGAWLFSGGWERELICWDIAGRRKAFTIAVDSYQARVRAGGDECALLTPHGVQLYSFESPTVFRGFPDDIGTRLRHATFAPDGRWLAACGDKAMAVWDLASRSPAAIIPGITNGHCAFSPDSREIIGRFGSSERQFPMRWRIAESAQPGAPPMLQRLPLKDTWNSTAVSLAAWSNAVVVTGRNGSQILGPGEFESGSERWSVTTPGINGVSPDGRWLGIYRSYGTSLYVYRMPGIERVRKLAHPQSIGGFQFSPSGDELAVCSRWGIEFWNTQTWESSRRLTNFSRVLYLPDGSSGWFTRHFRSAGLYRLESMEELLSLPSGLLPSAVSRDGARLAVSQDMRHVQVWDLKVLRRELASLGLDWAAR